MKIDYYAAPNCNTLCSSGSGTPKANGTQDCNCNEFTKITIHSTCENYQDVIPECGTNGGNYGGYGTYRGQVITIFYSTLKGNNKGTRLQLKKIPNDQSDIKVRVNGKTYTLTYLGKGVWKTSEIIFSGSGTYNVEFLN